MNQPRSFAPIIAAVLLLLSVLYVGGYLALVVPQGIYRSRERLSWDRSKMQLTAGHDDYRWGCDQADWFFWPLEQIDRKVRPEAWKRSAWVQP